MATHSVVDLRSDTVTRPSPGMKQAMLDAELGDDVWGDDPTINKLQEVVAAMFGHEAALYCPSGTMTNQIAIKVHTRPGDELLCADTAHIYVYESAGIAFNSGVQAKVLPAAQGRISAQQVERGINPPDVHFPRTALVCLENTTNKGGGAYYNMQEMKAIHEVCRRHKLPLHLDGARIFNAVAAAGYSVRDVGPLFDSISVCFSKGLGCPVGSVLLGSKEFIALAKRYRKVLGGGMRQAGMLAAACLYALEHNVGRMEEDHENARLLGAELHKVPFVREVLPVHTNIVIFAMNSPEEASAFMAQLGAKGVLVCPMSPTLLRMVTHLDVTREMVYKVCEVVRELAQSGLALPAAGHGP